MLAIAALSFLAIFALGAPFPVIVLLAAALGGAKAKAGLPAFHGSGRHGAMGKTHVADAETLLGAELHEMPTSARRGAIGAGLVALCLWLIPLAALAGIGFFALGLGLTQASPACAICQRQRASVSTARPALSHRRAA